MFKCISIVSQSITISLLDMICSNILFMEKFDFLLKWLINLIFKYEIVNKLYLNELFLRLNLIRVSIILFSFVKNYSWNTFWTLFLKHFELLLILIICGYASKVIFRTIFLYFFIAFDLLREIIRLFFIVWLKFNPVWLKYSSFIQINVWIEKPFHQ